MALFALSKWTRRQLARAALHVGLLAIAIAVAWQKDGPPADKAFWAVLIYFVGIAVEGFVEIVIGIFRRKRVTGGKGADSSARIDFDRRRS
jgi:hypothetical protein